jgi:hypothetical protein
LAKIDDWCAKLERSESAYHREVGAAQYREDVYNGDIAVVPAIYLENYEPYVPAVRVNRLVVKEIIAAKNIGGALYPKVRAKREQDIERAKVIEDFLLSETYRLNLAQQELEKYRNGAVHGGFGQLVQWIDDDAIPQSHSRLKVAPVYVQYEFVPQAGMYRSVEEMDYFFIKISASKEAMVRIYDIDVDGDYSIPKGKPTVNEDIIEYYRCYYRNEGGGVGVFAWTGNHTVLEDYENYLERKTLVCKECKTTFLESAVLSEGEREKCAVCGADEWESGDATEQVVYKDILDSKGNVVVSGVHDIMMAQRDIFGNTTLVQATGDDGQPVQTLPERVPYYVPKLYPYVLYRNAIAPDRVLGRSEAEELAPYQNAINFLHMQIAEKLMMSGDVITLPERDDMLITNRRREYYIRADEKSLIDVKSLQGNVSSEFAYEDRLYQMARYQAGVTDSFQGRPDMSAESAIAKQIQVAQTEQRMRENSVLREQSMRELYRRMFQTALAFADDKITYTQTLTTGETSEGVFCRYDFLERQEDGSWMWIDDFEFDVTEEQPLKINTSAQLQDLVSMFNLGVFSTQRAPEERARLGHALRKLGYQFADAIISGAEEDKNAAAMAGQQGIPAGEIAAPEMAGLIANH